MKILIISDAWHPQINGVVRTYESLIPYLEADGHIIKVIGPNDFKRTCSFPGYEEIKLVFFPYKKIQEIITKLNPDSIHIATEGSLGWSARKFCLKNKIKFTTSYHSQLPDYFAKRVAKYLPFLFNLAKNFIVKLIKKFHNASSCVLVTTESIEDQLKNWGIKTQTAILTRGVDEDTFYPADTNVFKNLKRPIALYVGRLALEKSIDDFLSMSWHGSKVIVGRGPEEYRLKKQYPDAQFLGAKTGKDLADCYRASDVFVFPSKTDTFGMVLIEALACGIPIAAYNVMGPKDIVTKDEFGQLGEDLDLAAKKAINSNLKQIRYNYIKGNYNWSVAAGQFIAAQNLTLE